VRNFKEIDRIASDLDEQRRRVPFDENSNDVGNIVALEKIGCVDDRHGKERHIEQNADQVLDVAEAGVVDSRDEPETKPEKEGQEHCERKEYQGPREVGGDDHDDDEDYNLEARLHRARCRPAKERGFGGEVDLLAELTDTGEPAHRTINDAGEQTPDNKPGEQVEAEVFGVAVVTRRCLSSVDDTEYKTVDNYRRDRVHERPEPPKKTPLVASLRFAFGEVVDERGAFPHRGRERWHGSIGANALHNGSDRGRRYDAHMVKSPVRDVVAAVTLVVLANGPLFFIERKGLDLSGTWEGPVVRPMIIGVALLSVLLVLLDSQRMSGDRLMQPNRLVMLTGIGFGAWAALSVLWSVNPEPTLWRGVVYMALPLVAWVLADLSQDRFVRSATVAFGSLIAVSVGLVAFWHSTGLDRNGDWKGIFTNRNGLAPICAIVILLSLSWILDGHRARGLVLLGLSTAALLGAGSRTAWIALFVSLGGSTLLVTGRRLMRERQGPTMPLAAVGTGVLGLLAAAGIVGSLWNEPTLVQRRTIWDLVGDHVADHPIHGSGFQAFWTVPELIGEHELLQRGSAHGSVQEILLGLGIVGLVLWGAVVLSAVLGTVRWAWHDPSTISWFWLALTTFLVIENLTESFVLWFSYNWVLLIAAALRAWHVPLRSLASQSVRSSARVTS